ncbi:MAG TPA: Sec-independent protein translocase protein TatB [Afifellaceae bacterium]|nr:Sec-independent protein translocase protein TatB [Afifellaceae bacterium]
MLDIGWTELVVIAVVAILVVGPKDLPRMLRSFGKTLGQLRRSANDFKRQFDDALREAEREADFEDTRKQVQSVTRIDPLGDLKKHVGKDLDPAKEARKETRAAVAANRVPASATGKQTTANPADAAADGATPTAPEPAKAESLKPAEARKDSDAA